jgi:hypothetical protein
MLRLLIQMRSSNCRPDVQECLRAFNRSERERRLPMFRRAGPRIVLISIVLFCFACWGVAVYWMVFR